jgi:hypothetical protein
VEQQVAGDQQQQPRDDGAVEREAPRPRAHFAGGLGLTRAPQAQTMLRVAHSILRSRPQAEQRRYVPGLKGDDVARGTRDAPM